MLEDELDIKISARAVRDNLVKAGFIARIPKKRHKLQKMKLLRLNWAKRHEKWNEEDWRKVIFSGESKFNLHGPDGRDYVRRRSGEAFHPDCLRSTVKYSAGQMIWGCFSYFGVGHLYFIDSTVKATTTTATTTTTTVYFNEVVFPSVLGLTSPMAFPQHSPPP